MMKRDRTILFVLAFLIIASLQVLVNPIYGLCAEQKSKSLDTYPITPEGVVEAFVRAYFDGVADEVIGDPNKVLQYTTWEGYSSSDVWLIALNYRITKHLQISNRAEVKVVFKIIGTLAGFENLGIGEHEAIAYIGLVKDNDKWKISYPAGGSCVSVKTAIKILEFGMIYYKDDLKKMEEIKKNINILKKYL